MRCDEQILVVANNSALRRDRQINSSSYRATLYRRHEQQSVSTPSGALAVMERRAVPWLQSKTQACSTRRRTVKRLRQTQQLFVTTNSHLSKNHQTQILSYQNASKKKRAEFEFDIPSLML